MTIELPSYTNKDVVFIGKGREGLSFQRFIQNHAIVSSFRFVDQEDGTDYLEKLKSLDYTRTVLVKTAGCPGGLVPVPYTTPTNLFFELIRRTTAKIIGVTGTKGKTTTTSLIARILRESHEDVRLCGNIGVPMLDTLDIPVSSDTIYVIELSSYQLADLKFSPNVGVITNIYNDHVDYHGSLEAYWGAKKHIMSYMSGSDIFVYPEGFPELELWAKSTQARTVVVPAIGTPEDPYSYIDMKKGQLIGEHNLSNARLAAATAKQFGCLDEDIQEAIRTFTPVKHRLQKVAVVNSLTYIDDAIASQPEAAIAGIKAVSNEVAPVGCLFVGGQDRAYDNTGFVDAIIEHKISRLVLFPDTGVKILELIKERHPDYEIHAHQTYDMNDAVVWASSNTPPNTAVLLSCGAPSYSLWKDFEEKGEQFQAAIAKL